MIVLKEFEFDAAHYLPEYNGKCERLHGHTYNWWLRYRARPTMKVWLLTLSA